MWMATKKPIQRHLPQNRHHPRPSPQRIPQVLFFRLQVAVRAANSPIRLFRGRPLIPLLVHCRRIAANAESPKFYVKGIRNEMLLALFLLLRLWQLVEATNRRSIGFRWCSCRHLAYQTVMGLWLSAGGQPHRSLRLLHAVGRQVVAGCVRVPRERAPARAGYTKAWNTKQWDLFGASCLSRKLLKDPQAIISATSCTRIVVT